MPRQWFVRSLIALIGLELVSWLSYGYPVLRTGITITVLVIVFALACYRLHWGIAVVVAELVVGSQGYLLAITTPFTLSFRLGLFAVIMLATVVAIIRERRIQLLHTHYWKWYLALVCVLAIATVTALFYGNDPKTIFLDANGYLFIAMIVPFVQALRTKQHLYQVIAVWLAGVAILILQTAGVLFVFSHSDAFNYYLPDLYRWLRDFRLAEITVQDNNFTRVFFQSHLYIVLAFILASVAYIKGWQRRWILPLLSATLTLIFISYSRSFWVAVAGVVVLLAIMAGKRALKYLLMVGGGLLVGYALTLALINVPLFSSGSGVDASALLADRTSNLTTDVGGGSRMALLQPLAAASIEHPLLGSGFGTEVTYATKDPRALAANEDGLYTTYAFEWGYLDLWLKLGLFGTLIYSALLAGLILRLMMQVKQTNLVVDQVILLTAAIGLVAVSAIHMLTPYLNHPLGLGWIVLATAIAIIYDQRLADAYAAHR